MKKGFTLIELIIAIAVLSIAIGSLFLVLANLVNTSVLPQVLNVGAGLAEEQLERVTQLRYSDVVNQGPANFGGNFSSYSYRIQVAAVPAALANDPGMANYKQVTVTVTHSTAGSVSATTVATNH